MTDKKLSVKIVVATHKKYKMPNDDMYIPLHVGAEGKKDKQGNPLDLGYQKDNTGENISELNASYCELTGLYWAWKNLDADFIGLSHYRRHFSLKKGKADFDKVLSYKEIEPYLHSIRVFVPTKRKYYIESLYSHYAHTHYAEHLDIVRDIISQDYPAYLNSFDKILNHTYGYMFNMMIMEKELLNDYCTWLFDILFKAGQKINAGKENAFQGRFYGRISEIIFNVWLDEQVQSGKIKKTEVKEIPCIHMEKINWYKKGSSFLKAKFLGKKYEGSF